MGSECRGRRTGKNKYTPSNIAELNDTKLIYLQDKKVPMGKRKEKDTENPRGRKKKEREDERVLGVEETK